MSQPRDADDPVSVLCRNLTSWRISAAEEGWRPVLEDAVSAARAGTLKATQLAQLLQVRYRSKLERIKDNMPGRPEAAQLLTYLEKALSEPDPDAFLEQMAEGGKLHRLLRRKDLENKRTDRQWPGSGRIFPDSLDSPAGASTFVCPRDEFPCGRREPRGAGGLLPRCAIDGDQWLSAERAHPEPR
jgi:hypothetical protein